jgi:hypothetical protein
VCFINNYFLKGKKRKKESRTSAAACSKPKGNGINAWITTADQFVVAGAGYIDPYIFCRFMPEAFGRSALLISPALFYSYMRRLTLLFFFIFC